MAANSTTNQELYNKNKVKIDSLRSYFLAIANRDSVLARSRFFPDSIFQANTNHSPPFKALIADYLTLKQSSSRAAFFKIKALNYVPPSEVKTNETLINFDHYWPLEVLALEAWVQAQEKKARLFSKKS